MYMWEPLDCGLHPINAFATGYDYDDYGAAMKTWEPADTNLLPATNWWLCYGRVFKRPHYLFPYQCTDTLKRVGERIREVYITRL